MIGQAFEIAFVFSAQLQLRRIAQLQEVLTVAVWSHSRYTMTIDDS